MCLVRTDAAIDRIQLEIQAGSRAASKVIQLVTPESEEEEEEDFSPDDEIQTKLKKILGIESVFRVIDFQTDFHSEAVVLKYVTEN